MCAVKKQIRGLRLLPLSLSKLSFIQSTWTKSTIENLFIHMFELFLKCINSILHFLVWYVFVFFLFRSFFFVFCYKMKKYGNGRGYEIETERIFIWHMHWHQIFKCDVKQSVKSCLFWMVIGNEQTTERRMKFLKSENVKHSYINIK